MCFLWTRQGEVESQGTTEDYDKNDRTQELPSNMNPKVQPF